MNETALANGAVHDLRQAPSREPARRRAPVRSVASRRGVEPFDALLWRLQARRAAGGPEAGVVGITGCEPGAGCSTVAMNLAVRASELGMGPVLLVETDVQRPKLQRLWRLAPGAGLAELFDGAASLADCLRDGPAADLHVLPAAAGPLRRQPTWETGVVDGLIAEAAADHSLVLFDLPAADCLQQFLMVAQRLDQALLVVRAERSRGPQVERAANCLLDDGVPLSGVILNGQRSYGPQWLLRRL